MLLPNFMSELPFCLHIIFLDINRSLEDYDWHKHLILTPLDEKYKGRLEYYGERFEKN